MLNTTTINENLNRKFEAWLASIQDKKVRDLAATNSIITGGCIPSMLLNEPIKDYDIYFRDFMTMYEVVNYYTERFHPTPQNKDEITLNTSVVSSKKFGEIETSENRRLTIEIKSNAHGVVAGISEHGIVPKTERESQEYKDKIELHEAVSGNYRPTFVTTNAITLSDQVQCMVRFWGEPDKIHENYDFAHCTNYWTSWTRKVNLRQKAMDALNAKELRYTKTSKYPVSALMRVKKFLDRGWTITDDEIQNIAADIGNLDLHDDKVRLEQLIGVSTTAMSLVLTKSWDLAEGNLNYKDFMKMLEELKSIRRTHH